MWAAAPAGNGAVFGSGLRLGHAAWRLLPSMELSPFKRQIGEHTGEVESCLPPLGHVCMAPVGLVFLLFVCFVFFKRFLADIHEEQ